jgi:hypothetical protein
VWGKRNKQPISNEIEIIVIITKIIKTKQTRRKNTQEFVYPVLLVEKYMPIKLKQMWFKIKPNSNLIFYESNFSIKLAK